MYVLKIEYPVSDYDAWKVAFDRDVLDREGSGVRRYRVLRPTDHPTYVMIDLDFDDADEVRSRRAVAPVLFVTAGIFGFGWRSADAHR